MLMYICSIVIKNILEFISYCLLLSLFQIKIKYINNKINNFKFII